MTSRKETYSDPDRLSILAWFLIIVTPVLIWRHPLIDASLAVVPAVIGLRLLTLRSTRRRRVAGGGFGDVLPLT